jgi:predicted exporter
VQEPYASFRSTGLRPIGIGTLLVFALVLLRYRRLRPTVVACLPAVLAAATVFACFGLAGLRPNLLDLVSLVLVLGMGVDYGVFVVDSARDPKHLGATLLSILLSALTTVFAFGALALSSHPALRSIGLTSGLGMVLAFVLAPTALALTGERRRNA